MKTVLLFLLATLATAATGRAQSASTNVLDWKGNTTLSSYLKQQLHAQYAGRSAELARAAQSAAGAAAYRDSVRARCRRALGPLPARTPLRAQVVGQLARPGFRIEKIIYESTPNHHVTANLYVPDGPGRWPTVLFPCGHEAEAKATVSYQQTAMLFATHGFVVLVPDPISQGERLQLTDAAGKGLTRGGTTEHTLLNAQAALVGHNLPAAELWDNIRGLDYLATRPDVDTARFGCLGNSGGATQTAYLLAAEPRLKVAALCSYVAAGERNLELTGPADGCVMLPNAGRLRLDMADWPLAFAPQPLLLLAGRYDFVDYTSIEIAHAEISSIYRALGQLQHALFTVDDGHGISRPKREAAVRFFLKWLKGEAAPVVVHEGPLPIATARELQCTSTGQVNTSFADEENLSAFYQAKARHLAATRPALSSHKLSQQLLAWLGKEPLRARLASRSEKALPACATEPRDTLRRGGLLFRKLIVRCGQLPPLPVLRLDAPGSSPRGRVLLCFADAGKASLADSSAWLRQQLKHYDTVLLADLRGQGETADPAAALDPKYYNREYRPAMLALHLGQPLLHERVIDAMQLVDYAATATGGARVVDVYAAGQSSALVALHAAAAKGAVEQVRLPVLPLSWAQALARPTARDGYSDVVPAVLRHYDVPDVVRLLGPRLKRM